MLLGFIYVILACVGWGTIGVFVNSLSKLGFDSTQLAVLRCVISAIVLWMLLIVKGKKNIKIKPIQLLYTALEGISFFCMAMFYFMAIQKTTASTASLMLSISAIVIMLASVLIWKEKLTASKIIALIMAIIGCGFVVGIISGFRFEAEGMLLSVAAMIMYAGYGIFTKLAVKSGLNSETNIAYSFLFSGLFGMLCRNPVKIAEVAIKGSEKEIILMIAFAVVTGAFAGLMYTKSMKLLPAGVVGACATLDTLISTVLSVLFLNEKLTVESVIGFILIISSVIILNIGEKINVKHKMSK